MGQAAFLYGIGAARAGTTWLARALRMHPQAALPPVKELHYFDALDQDRAQWAMDQLMRARQAMRDELTEATRPALRKKLTTRLSELDRWIGLVGTQEQDDARYEALMQRRIGDDTRVVADITPAYATMQADVFKRMAALNGGDVRFVMLLRDPVDRLWSNVRLTLARRVAKGLDPEQVRQRLVGDIASTQDTPELARADYAATLDRLKNTVDADKQQVLFFEDIITGKGVEALSGFLNLDTPLDPPEEAVNTTDDLDMRPEERAILRRVTDTQYEFAAAHLGKLPKRWTENMKESAA